MADQQGINDVMDAAEEGTARQTSLRYLRLENGFRNMLKSGMGHIDEQTFKNHFKGKAETRHLNLLWQLLQRQCEAIINIAMAEMEQACSEVGLQQQLEELEKLILQRGLLGKEDSNAVAVTALPTAAEAAARMEAKQAEKQRLQQILQELQKQQQSVRAQLEQKQQQADDLKNSDKHMGDQVDKVYKAAMHWVQPAPGAGAEPMQQ